MSDDLCFLGAVDALRAFAARTLSPVELLDAVLARADQVEPTINAITSRRLDHAHAAAAEAEQRWSNDTARPLEGLPVALKEEQPILGESWQLGSLLLEHEVAPLTHPVIERIFAAGGVGHVRTATPEFSCAGFTHTKLWGTTRNPWNTDITCGGSSGGSGASLASGTSTLATGSDIGGSIRVPSSLNGVVGFKPPQGRVPTLPPFHLDLYCHEGPMGRSVADVALLHNVIAGAHSLDHSSMPHPPVIPLTHEGVAGLRIALAVTVGDIPVDDDVAANTLAFADVLRAAGATVIEVPVEIPRSVWMTAAMIHFGAIFGASVTAAAGDRPDLLTDYAASFAERSGAIFAEHGTYAGLNLESAVQATIASAMDGFDALICPTLGTVGWLAGESYADTKMVVGGETLSDYFEASFTVLFNIASRHPVLNVPSGRASNGVPTGIQIVGRTYDDVMPFRIGAAAERELGWWGDPSWRPTA